MKKRFAVDESSDDANCVVIRKEILAAMKED
jgi:hypothetical protein